eukprot:8204612-Pyramimonas_sp.AAC.1
MSPDPTPKNKEKFFEWDPEDKSLKVAAWQKYTKGLTKDQVLGINLREYFNEKQMTWLWARLKRKELPSTSAEFQEKYDSNMKNKHVVKNQVLKLNVGCPDEWQEHSAVVLQKFTQSHSKSVETGWYSRGELQQMK